MSSANQLWVPLSAFEVVHLLGSSSGEVRVPLPNADDYFLMLSPTSLSTPDTPVCSGTRISVPEAKARFRNPISVPENAFQFSKPLLGSCTYSFFPNLHFGSGTLISVKESAFLVPEDIHSVPGPPNRWRNPHFSSGIRSSLPEPRIGPGTPSYS